MCPFRNAKRTAIILLLDRVANIDEFSVFEDQKIVLRGKRLETSYCLFVEVCYDINVGLENCDVRTKRCFTLASAAISALQGTHCQQAPVSLLWW